jgi:hypothetical protein
VKESHVHECTRHAGAALPLGGVLMVRASSAAAITPAAVTAAGVSARTAHRSRSSVLTAPTLTSATKSGDEVVLLFTPPASERSTRDYAIHADGRFAHRTAPPVTSTTVFLTSEGLTGRETFTLVAEDGAGNASAPSNGLVPVAPAVLAAPTMTSAVISGGRVTLKWTASHTDEVSGTLIYSIVVDGGDFTAVPNSTFLTRDVTNYDRVLPVTVRPGSQVTVAARDLTFFSRSPQSNAVAATLR